MDWQRLLLITIVVLLVGLGYYDLNRRYNWSKEAVAYYTATYCKDPTCVGEQKDFGEYLYPSDMLGCDSVAKELRYFIPAGKALIPVFDTYYIRPETCQVFYIANP